MNMYVSIAVDPSSRERAKEIADLLAQYGFKMVQKGLWESMAVSQDTLNRVKRDLDNATDAFDRLRLFQFPMEGTLVLTSLRDKKWRRLVAKDAEADKLPETPAAPPVSDRARELAKIKNNWAALHKAAARAGVVMKPVRRK